MARRLFGLCVALTFVLLIESTLWAAQPIPETVLASKGLMRPWFSQVQLDRNRASLTFVTFIDGIIYAQTDTALVHAIDAETGKTLWSRQVGERNRPSLRIDARDDRVGLINGSRLYVLDRPTGKVLYERDVIDAPGAGPALNTKRVFVPSVTGMLTAFQLPPTKATASNMTTADAQALRVATPLRCQGYGPAFVQPMVTREFVGGEYVVWPTDRGYLNFGRIERQTGNVLILKYRLQTRGKIVARPAYLPPNPKVLGDSGIVFAASTDGFVYAVLEDSGATLWRFSTGEPIRQSPAVIENHLYIVTDLGRMYCLDVKTGKSLWSLPGVAQFIAASKTRVYVTSPDGDLLALSAANGAKLATIPTLGSTMCLANTDTDRIYLISNGGLIQCLREIEQNVPLVHSKVRKDWAKSETKRAKSEEEAESGRNTRE